MSLRAHKPAESRDHGTRSIFALNDTRRISAEKDGSLGDRDKGIYLSDWMPRRLGSSLVNYGLMGTTREVFAPAGGEDNIILIFALFFVR